MKKILIATHGYYAKGILSSIEMLVGKHSQVSVINAYVEEMDLKKEIKDFVKSIKSDDSAVVFTDLYGGSVNQTITKFFLENEVNIPIITGFNFPIVLEVLLSTEKLTPENIEKLIQSCRREMKVSMIYSDNDSSNEDDFFE